jgi:hypothetical protein
MSDFYRYFKENMDGLGLLAPESLFGSVQTATATASVIFGAVEKFGTRVTVLEVIRAGTKLEALGVIGACSAAYYAGAVVGSLAVAAGRSIAGGTSLADALFVAKQNELDAPWMRRQLQREPKLYKGQVSRAAASGVAR